MNITGRVARGTLGFKLGSLLSHNVALTGRSVTSSPLPRTDCTYKIDFDHHGVCRSEMNLEITGQGHFVLLDSPPQPHSVDSGQTPEGCASMTAAEKYDAAV